MDKKKKEILALAAKVAASGNADKLPDEIRDLAIDVAALLDKPSQEMQEDFDTCVSMINSLFDRISDVCDEYRAVFIMFDLAIDCKFICDNDEAIRLKVNCSNVQE